MTDAQAKALDECSRAVSVALRECARTKSIDPAEDVSDPAYCLAVEATQLLAAVRELRGRRAPARLYA